MKKPHENPNHAKETGAAIPKSEVEPNRQPPLSASAVEMAPDFTQAQPPGSNVARPKK